MTLKWFKVFNKTVLDATGLVSRTATFTFDQIGDVTLTIFKANYYSIIVDDVFLSLNMSDNSPFVFENRGIYIDANQDIWIGYPP